MERMLLDIRNENKWIREAFNNVDMVSIDTIMNKIEDLLDDISNLKEELDEYRYEEEDREAWDDIHYERWKEQNGW